MSSLRGGFTFALAAALGSLLVAACGGKTVGVDPGDAGPIGAPDTGVPTGSCVDIHLGDYDQSCEADTDCTLIEVGTHCSTDSCGCGGTTPINVDGQARYESAVAGITCSGPVLGCPFFGNARCIQNQCTLCGPGPNQPGGCSEVGSSDGGTIIITPPDAGVPDTGIIEIRDAGAPDTGVTTSDGGACVDVALSSYSTSCNVTSDCILIQTGTICDGDCSCSGVGVNISGQAQYDQAVSPITFGACSCPSVPSPTCVAGACTVCVGTNQPAGCP